MALSGEERIEILQLLSEGNISVDEAERMLSGKKADSSQPATADHISVTDSDIVKQNIKKSRDQVSEATGNGDRPKWFHVRVSDLKTGQGKVTVNIPLSLVKAGLNIGRRYAPDLDGIEWSDLSGVIVEEKGVLVDVEDEEDGEHVQIYVD